MTKQQTTSAHLGRVFYVISAPFREISIIPNRNRIKNYSFTLLFFEICCAVFFFFNVY